MRSPRRAVPAGMVIVHSSAMGHLLGSVGGAASRSAEIRPIHFGEHFLATDTTAVHLFERDAVVSGESAKTIPPEANCLDGYAALTSHLCWAASTFDCGSDCVHC